MKSKKIVKSIYALPPIETVNAVKNADKPRLTIILPNTPQK